MCTREAPGALLGPRKEPRPPARTVFFAQCKLSARTELRLACRIELRGIETQLHWDRWAPFRGAQACMDLSGLALACAKHRSAALVYPQRLSALIVTPAAALDAGAAR